MDAAWNYVPSDIKETIIRVCFTDENVVMTDEIFLNMMCASREQAPAIHKMVVEAIDPYLPIEKEGMVVDWESFLKRMTISSIMEFLTEHNIKLTISSEERRNKQKLIACISSALKRDPMTMLRQKRVDNIKRSISFSKQFVNDDNINDEMQIMRESLIAKYRRSSGMNDLDTNTINHINEQIDMIFGKKPPASLHPDLLQRDIL